SAAVPAKAGAARPPARDRPPSRCAARHWDPRAAARRRGPRTTPAPLSRRRSCAPYARLARRASQEWLAKAAPECGEVAARGLARVAAIARDEHGRHGGDRALAGGGTFFAASRDPRRLDRGRAREHRAEHGLCCEARRRTLHAGVEMRTFDPAESPAATHARLDARLSM